MRAFLVEYACVGELDIFSTVVRSMRVSVRFFFDFFPATRVIVARPFSAGLSATFNAGGLARDLLVVIRVSVLNVAVAGHVDAGADAYTGFVRVIRDFLTGDAFVFVLVRYLDVVRGYFSRTMGGAKAVLMVILFGVHLEQRPFASGVAVLEYVIHVQVIFLPVGGLGFAFFDERVEIVGDCKCVRTQFAVAVRVVYAYVDGDSSVCFFIPGYVVGFCIWFKGSIFVQAIVEGSILRGRDVSRELDCPWPTTAAANDQYDVFFVQAVVET